MDKKLEEREMKHLIKLVNQEMKERKRLIRLFGQKVGAVRKFFGLMEKGKLTDEQREQGTIILDELKLLGLTLTTKKK